MASRVTQVATEVFLVSSSKLRVTQFAVEAFVSNPSHLRVTQIAIEILVPNVTAATRRRVTDIMWI